MLFIQSSRLSPKLEDALNQDMAIAPFPYLEPKVTAYLSVILVRAGMVFYGTDPHSFGSKLLVGGAGFSRLDL